MVPKFPFQNTSLINLPKERWKDTPGVDDTYHVSNYGRVKTLPQVRFMHTPHQGSYISKEMIRKVKPEVKRNKTVEDNIYTLIVSLSREGRRCHYSVVRVVYHTFIEEFDLTNHTCFISYKEGNGINIHVSNLFKSTISKIKLKSYGIGRVISHLLSFPYTLHMDRQKLQTLLIWYLLTA